MPFLLDENIPQVIAEQINIHYPDIPIFSIHTWQDGRLMGTTDREILTVAAQHNLILVTRDVSTIPYIITEMINDEIDFTGIIFVPDAAFPPRNYGLLIDALVLANDDKDPWTNRLVYLHANEK